MNFKKPISMDDFLSFMNAYTILTRLNPEKYSNSLDAFADWMVALGIAEPGISQAEVDRMMEANR